MQVPPERHSSPHFNHLSRLVYAKGSPEENALLEKWKQPVGDFFLSHKRGLTNKQQVLEIGLEDKLSLKLNIKSAQDIPAASLLTSTMRQPAFNPWRELILEQGLRFHSGIKLTPEKLSRELYVYASTNQISQILGAGHPVTLLAKRVLPKFIGIDNERGLSLYFNANDEAFLARIQADIKQKIDGDQFWLWQQVRYEDEQIKSGKAGFEVKPLPLPLTVRLLSHFDFPHFRYLIPKKNLASGNFGRDVTTGRQAFYANVSSP